MLEVLQTILLTVVGFGIAIIIAGCVAGSIAWMLREERPDWMRAITMLCLISFFVVGPVIALIYSWITADPYQPYDDHPYHENIYDRYS